MTTCKTCRKEFAGREARHDRPGSVYCSEQCRRRQKGVRTLASCNTGETYDDEQAEWLRAVAAFRTQRRRPPTLAEAYALALSLGYRREG